MHVHAPHPGPVVRLTAAGTAANDDDRVEQMTHVQRLQLCETCGHALATLACLLLYCGISLESGAHADITRQPEHSNVYVCRLDTAENTQSVGAGGTVGIGALGGDDEVLLKAVKVSHGDVRNKDAITAAQHITLICQRKQSISFDETQFRWSGWPPAVGGSQLESSRTSPPH
jgi:hypothetical protein